MGWAPGRPNTTGSRVIMSAVEQKIDMAFERFWSWAWASVTIRHGRESEKIGGNMYN